MNENVFITLIPESYVDVVECDRGGMPPVVCRVDPHGAQPLDNHFDHVVRVLFDGPLEKLPQVASGRRLPSVAFVPGLLQAGEDGGQQALSLLPAGVEPSSLRSGEPVDHLVNQRAKQVSHHLVTVACADYEKSFL